MNSKFSSLLMIIIALFIAVGCAKRGRPEGGPKDETAPIMVTANPDHLSTNFDAKKIRLSFDEYIKLKELNQQLVISPPMKYEPTITPVGSASDVINIKILDTLKENTTYTFNFGKSIEDNNEGNPLARFKYVFSTGDYIDSLYLAGTVKDAFLREADDNVSIQLYEVTEDFNDSIIFKQKPSYVTNALDTTFYEITNLKAGTYLMIALLDKNNNYTFEPKLDKIDYVDEFVTLPTDSTYHFTLYKETLNFKIMRPTEVKKGHIYFGYEGGATGIQIDLISDRPDDFKSTLVFEKDYDSLSYWYTPIEADSLIFKVEHQNSLDTLIVNLRSKEIDSLNVGMESGSILSLRDTFNIATNVPIETIDKSKISILDKDSIPVNFTTQLASTKMNLYLNFEKKYDEKYKLKLLPDAIVDLFGVTNDTLNYNVATKFPEDYGSIGIQLQNVEQFPIIVELLDEGDQLIERIVSNERTNFTFEHLNPNNYMVRVIYDSNKNNVWDPGNYLGKTKPESVVYFHTYIELRANWDVIEPFNVELK